MKEQKFPSRKELLKRLQEESCRRITLSFYRYVIIDEVENLRVELLKKWKELNVFGRIYIAQEGINAQISIPEEYFRKFQKQLYSDKRFSDVPFKIAVEDNGKSFYKLTIKIRKKIVADGLSDDAFDVTNVGKHLSAEEWNNEMNKAVIVDMRNIYESEVGYFENAICPEAHSFRQELPMVMEILQGKENEKILLYCTGGIRCEKASAYLKHHGFRDVSQLYGGIIEYARQVKQNGLESKFKGKNFVFDERMGERITSDIVSKCHQCGSLCDTHVNCSNDECHLLFIQCDPCKNKFDGCCSEDCKIIVHLPVDEQKKIQRAKEKNVPASVFSSRKRIMINRPVNG